MSEIKCPHCGEVFQVDESGWQQIVSQVRTAEFARDLRAREQAMRVEHEQGVELVKASMRTEYQELLSQRDSRIAQLEAKLAGLGDAAEAEKLLAVQRAQDALKDERFDLLRRCEELQVRVEEQARQAELDKQLAVQHAESAALAARVEVERERDELSAQVERQRVEADAARAAYQVELAEKLHAKDEQIADRDREIERIRDMRTRLSTKMLGETLEQHCEVAFNQIRMTAFPTAFFEKDTEAVADIDGTRPTKGDYIFRESDDDGNEVVSIMFEMKNEQEDGVGHKRNEDHFKKLDADRVKKGCEYAVLVSTLEPDSELYNTGIVDVSYRYPKMYVVRPQFFIPIITLLRNAALNSMRYKAELAEARRQSIDVTNFEAKLEDFKEKFGRNYELASRRFQNAIDEIDKTIDHLQKVRESLVGSERNLALANRKAEDLTIKRLTRGNATMRDLFKKAAEQRDGDLGADAADEDDAVDVDGEVV